MGPPASRATALARRAVPQKTSRKTRPCHGRGGLTEATAARSWWRGSSTSCLRSAPRRPAQALRGAGGGRKGARPSRNGPRWSPTSTGLSS
eukprot:9893884-Lingulodinium_polyedra.AAC.1